MPRKKCGRLKSTNQIQFKLFKFEPTKLIDLLRIVFTKGTPKFEDWQKASFNF